MPAPSPCRCCRKRPLGVYGKLCDPCRQKLTAPAAHRLKTKIGTIRGMYWGSAATQERERHAWDRQRCAWRSKTPRVRGYQATFDVDDVRGFRPEAARAR